MTEKYKARLFLTYSEREDIFQMIDALADSDIEDEEEEAVRNRWMKILTTLVYGKGEGMFPIVLTKD